MDVRKYGIVIAVAILSAIFMYSVADAVAPQVKYNTCENFPRAAYYPAPSVNCSAVPVDRAAEETCVKQENSYQAVYDEYGCVESYECSTCYKEQQDKQKLRSTIMFYTLVGLGLLAIIGGFMLPEGGIHEWVGIGFILGGVLALFIGTAQHWENMARVVRPLIIAAELAILLFIVYRKLRTEAKKND
jgi:hypothetical protein